MPASLLAGGTRALVAAGDLRTSRERFDDAYRAAERTGDAHTLVAAALGLGGLWVHEHRSAAGATSLSERLRRALALVDPRSSLALRLRLRLTAETDYLSGRHASTLALLEEARSSADPIVLMEALSLAHHCVMGPEHGELRRRIAAELIAASLRTERGGDLAMALMWHVVDLFLDGRPHAHRELGDLREFLKHDDHLAVGFVVSAIEVMLAVRAGRFDEAEELSRACAERGAQAGDVDATGWHGGQLLAIRWYQGRVLELLPVLDELVHSPTLSAVDNSFVTAQAVVAATAGDRRKAAGALAALGDLAELPRSSTWLVTMNGVVQAANLLDDADLSAQAYELLLPFARLPMMASLAVTCFGSTQHALGVASLTTGHVDRAVDHLRAAVKDNLALAHWPATLHSRLRYAEALTRAGEISHARSERAIASGEAASLGISLPATRNVVCTCRREGAQWKVQLGQRSVRVEHCVGMLHLAVLLANPGREIDAVDLVDGVRALSSQPVLDRAAVQQYRNRLDDLDDGAERDWLLAELAGATGLTGRSRQFVDSGERARLAVGKAIRRALTRLTEADAVIGEHLRRAVHTGKRCDYRPM